METARRCGIVLDSRTLRRKEVEASCPFCHDHGPGKYHLSLNADTDQYRCNLCGAHGNSVSLYARIKGISNAEAYRELVKESKVYPMPQQPTPQNSERQPVSLEQRHAAYSDIKNLCLAVFEELDEDEIVSTLDRFYDRFKSNRFKRAAVFEGANLLGFSLPYFPADIDYELI